MIEILLATYNGEKYIEEQIASLLQQTEQDFRILVRDDGSTDRTVAKIAAIQKTHPEKIRLIHDEKKCGNPTANFMELIAHATADYVMFCDQDDFWYPEKLKRMLQVMTETERHALCPVIVFSDYRLTDEQRNPLNVDESKLQIASFQTEFRKLMVQNYLTGCTMMLNRNCYEKFGIYDAAIQMHDWWAALYCSAVGKIVHLPEKLMDYRQHGNNVVSAGEVSWLAYIKSKIHDPRAKNNWKLASRQMQLFRERYGEELNSESRKALEEFLDVEHHGKIVRIRKMLHGGFTKSGALRVLGQIFYI